MVEGRIVNGDKYGTVKDKEGKENVGLQFRHKPVDRDAHTLFPNSIYTDSHRTVG